MIRGKTIVPNPSGRTPYTAVIVFKDSVTLIDGSLADEMFLVEKGTARTFHYATYPEAAEVLNAEGFWNSAAIKDLLAITDLRVKAGRK